MMDPNDKHQSTSARPEWLVEHHLKWTDKYLLNNNFFQARNHLNHAKGFGATPQEISTYEEKIKAVEVSFQVKKTTLINLAKSKILERDLDAAKKITDSLKQLKVVTEVMEIETEIKCTEYIQKVESHLTLVHSLLAQEYCDMTKISTLIQEARSDLHISKIYKLSSTRFENYENVINCLEIIVKIEKNIASALKYHKKEYLDKAKKCFNSLKDYDIPSEKIRELKHKIDATAVEFISEEESNRMKAAEHLEKVKNTLIVAKELLVKNDHDVTDIHNAITMARGDLDLAKTFDKSSEHLTVFHNQINALEMILLTKQHIDSAQRYHMNWYLDKAKSCLNSAKQYGIKSKIIEELHNNIDAAAELIFQKESGTVEMGIRAPSHNVEKLISFFSEDKNEEIPAVHKPRPQKGREEPIPMDVEQSNDYEKEKHKEEEEEPQTTNTNRQDFTPTGNSETTKSFTSTIHITLTEHKRRVEYDTACKNDSEFDNVINNHGNNQRYLSTGNSQNDVHYEHAHIDNDFIRNTGHSEHFSPAQGNKGHTVDSENRATCAKHSTVSPSYANVVNQQSANTNSFNHAHSNAKQVLKQSTEKHDKENDIACFEATKNHEDEFNKTINKTKSKPPIAEKPDHLVMQTDNQINMKKPDVSQRNTSESAKFSNYDKTVTPKEPDMTGTAIPEKTYANLVDNTNKEKPITYADKCIRLVKKALDEGNVEIAKKMVSCGEKLYPEADFSFVKTDIIAASPNIYAGDNLATKIGYLHIDDKYNPPKPINTTENNVNNNNITQKMSNTGYALKTKEKSYVHSIEDTVDDVSEDNVHGNKDEAKICLDKAEKALAEKDFEKAERLALKSDRMCPNEDAKTLVAKVVEARNSYNNENNSGVKTEGSNYAVTDHQDSDQARKCLEIACTAFEEDKLDKCKRFLKKAKNFDNSLNIECYLVNLHEKKVQAELEKERKKKEAEVEAKRKEAEEEEKRKEAEEKAKRAKETEKKPGLVEKFFNTTRNIFRGTDSKQGAIPKTKPQVQDKTKPNKKENKKGDSENLNNFKHGYNEDKPTAVTVAQENNNNKEIPDEDMYNTNASGGSNSRHYENNSNSENIETSAEEKAKIAHAEKLVEDALRYLRDQDFEGAEALLTTAYGLNPIDSTKLLLDQAKEEAAKIKENQEKQNANNRIERASKNEKNESNAYYDNMQHIEDKFRPPRTFRSTHRSQPYENGRARPNRSKSRGAAEKPPKEQQSGMQNWKQIPEVSSAETMRLLATRAMEENNFSLAEKYLIQSEQINPNPITRDMLCKVRVALNGQSNIYF